MIGVNAAWTNPDVFLDSLWLSDPAVASPTSPIDVAGGDNVDGTGEPSEIAPKIYAYSSLLALRAYVRLNWFIICNLTVFSSPS